MGAERGCFHPLYSLGSSKAHTRPLSRLLPIVARRRFIEVASAKNCWLFVIEWRLALPNNKEANKTSVTRETSVAIHALKVSLFGTRGDGADAVGTALMENYWVWRKRSENLILLKLKVASVKFYDQLFISFRLEIVLSAIHPSSFHRVERSKGLSSIQLRSIQFANVLRKLSLSLITVAFHLSVIF